MRKFYAMGNGKSVSFECESHAEAISVACAFLRGVPNFLFAEPAGFDGQAGDPFDADIYGKRCGEALETLALWQAKLTPAIADITENGNAQAAALARVADAESAAAAQALRAAIDAPTLDAWELARAQTLTAVDALRALRDALPAARFVRLALFSAETHVLSIEFCGELMAFRSR